METFSEVLTDISDIATESRPPMALKGYIQNIKRDISQWRAVLSPSLNGNKSSLSYSPLFIVKLNFHTLA